jgi:glycosyltransferase involved in cell wall biosynthesis
MKITYFVRKKFSGYFSIEQIFSTICGRLNALYGEQVTCAMDEVPHHFSPGNFIRNILYVRRRQTAINHITGDIHYAILGCSRANLNVLTIHDCVILGRFRKWDIRYWIFRIFWYELPLWKADIVTVISEKTKQELQRTMWLGRRKLQVIGNFVDPVFQYAERSFHRDKPVLLFIGSTENKNLTRVLDAVKGLNCRLDIIGCPTEHQHSLISSYGIDVELSYGITKAQVHEKYAACDIVLFPSLYEGFGMLIVEANAVGRPVVTSNLSPMREVAGGAACLVDPYSTQSIRAGIEKIICDPAYREELLRKGLENRKRFDLDSVVNMYLDCYLGAKKNIQ